MPKAKRINDPVFGPLTWDGSWWEGTAGKAGRAGRVELRVDGDPDPDDDCRPPPTEAQRAAYRQVLSHPRGVQGFIQDAVWWYYREVVVRHYRTQMDPMEAALAAPDLKEPSEVWPLVSSLVIDIPADQRKPTVVVRGNCDWDEEHGFDVERRGGKFKPAD